MLSEQTFQNFLLNDPALQDTNVNAVIKKCAQWLSLKRQDYSQRGLMLSCRVIDTLMEDLK